jgi:hypothetical protein
LCPWKPLWASFLEPRASSRRACIRRALEAGERLMALEDQVAAGIENAFARQPIVDRVRIVQTLRRANRSLGRSLGRVEWSGSVEAYLRRSAELSKGGRMMTTGRSRRRSTFGAVRSGEGIGPGRARRNRATHVGGRASGAHERPSEPVAAAARLPQLDRAAVSGHQLSPGCVKRRGARGERSATEEARVRRRQRLEMATTPTGHRPAPRSRCRSSRRSHTASPIGRPRLRQPGVAAGGTRANGLGALPRDRQRPGPATGQLIWRFVCQGTPVGAVGRLRERQP